ncbi:MAG: hypothetical protein AAF348_07455 [Bacteroidota bacterium]
MDEFWKHFLGEQTVAFHVAGILFALMGTLVAKAHFYFKHKAQQAEKGIKIKFNTKYWLNENLLQVIITLIASFLAVRFIDVLLHWLNPKIKAGFGFEIPNTEDQIFYYLIVSGLLQFWVHIKYKK